MGGAWGVHGASMRMNLSRIRLRLGSASPREGECSAEARHGCYFVTRLASATQRDIGYMPIQQRNHAIAEQGRQLVASRPHQEFEDRR